MNNRIDACNSPSINLKVIFYCVRTSRICFDARLPSWIAALTAKLAFTAGRGQVCRALQLSYLFWLLWVSDCLKLLLTWMSVVYADEGVVGYTLLWLPLSARWFASVAINSSHCAGSINSSLCWNLHWCMVAFELLYTNRECITPQRRHGYPGRQ